MRDKLTKIVAVSVALVMAASCVSLSIAGHSTNNESFDDRLPTENVTAVHYHRMPINAVEHFDSHLEHVQRYDNGFSEENEYYFDSRHGYPCADRSLREFEADLSEQTHKKALTGKASQQTSGTVEQHGSRSVVSQSSNTIYVPDECAKIQWAVDNASAGDTIIVRDGIYTENMNVNTPHLTIRSKNGAENCIVNASNQYDHVFKITADYVNISGFTIKGATEYCNGWKAGIYLNSVNYCKISSNNVKDNKYGLYLESSSINTIKGNTASLNTIHGIYLCYLSNNNVIMNNTVNTNNGKGLYLASSNNNKLMNNNVSINGQGISLLDSSNNTLINNTANLNFWCGISLLNSTDNTLINNTANNGYNGIALYGYNNTLNNNIMSGNKYNFGVGHGERISDYVQNIDTSNKVDGKTVYYWINRKDQQIPSDAGYVGIVNSTNITVKDLTLTNNIQGVFLAYSNKSRIENVSVLKNNNGIWLVHSNYNTLTTNIANFNNDPSIVLRFSDLNVLTNNIANSNKDWGIFLADSDNNILTNNVANSNRDAGINLVHSVNNTLANNIANFSTRLGINVLESINNTLINNTASNNVYGIRLLRSSNNALANNTAKLNAKRGISLHYSSNNSLTNNKMSRNRYNFGVHGDNIYHFIQNIDTSNKVDGKTVYYWINRKDQQIPSDAGYVGIVNSTNITLKDLTLTKNIVGVLLAYSNNSRIDNVTASNNYYYGFRLYYSNNNTLKNNVVNFNDDFGIWLKYSTGNTISNNTVSYNGDCGISLFFSSNNTLTNNNVQRHQFNNIYLYASNSNRIYLNNFINNTNSVYSEDLTNIWNSTEKITYTYNDNTYTNYLGNYWDDFTDTDTNGNGIWDNPYSIDGDKDYYPLKERFENYFEQPPSLNGKIVFHSNRDNNFEIYIMDADGTNQTRLTRNAGNDHYAVWSQDWTKIAFTSEKDGNEEIYVMNPNGTNQNRLTYNSASDWVPEFSPDGKKIAFTSNRDGNSEVYIMNSEGGNQTRLTENNADDRDPEWSITNKIVFESNRDGNPEIYLMGADGNNVIRLTHNSAVDRHPAWYSDGSKIVFTSDRDGNDEIYVMNADGSNQMRITYNSASDLDPTWSPDGNYFVFSTNRTGNYEIYRMDTDGSNQTRLTVNTNEDYRPDWGLPASIPNYPPNPPTNLAQFKSDSTTEIPVGGTTNERTVSFKGTVSDPDGDMVKLQVELRRLDEYGGLFDETKGGLKDSDFVASGSEAVAYAEELIDADYHWRARVVDEHGDSSNWQEFGGNDVSDADFVVNQSEGQSDKDKLIDSLEELREAMLFKLDWEIDTTAQTFTSVRGYQQSKKWADIFGAPLNILQGTLQICSIPQKIKELAEEPNRAFTASKSLLEGLSISVMMHGLIESGEDMYYGLYGPPYGKAVEDMLKSADDEIIYSIGPIEFNFDPNIYKDYIKSYLILPPSNARSPLLITRRSGKENRNIIGSSEGILRVRISINKEFNSLIEDINRNDLPEDFPTEEVIAQINELTSEIKQSLYATGNIDVEYDTYLQDEDEYIPKHVQIKQGAPAKSQEVFRDMCSMVAEKIDYEITAEMVNLEENIELVISYSIPELGKSIEIPQTIISIAGMTCDVATVTYYSNAEDEFYMLPQEMLFSVQTESSNLWMIADDVNRYLRYRIDILEPSIPEDQIPVTWAHLCSPGELSVYDAQRRVTGLVNGEIKEEIPDSDYYENTVTIFFPSDSYRYEVVGTDTGTYGLDVTSVKDGNATNFTAIDIPTLANATHQYTINWSALSVGGKGVTIKIDSDGDGVFEQHIITDDTFYPPIANFTYSAENPIVTQLITFNASNSTDPDGFITEYEWDFCDGNITNTTEAIINHSYASTGVYTVNLTVTDNDGATNTKTKLITVTRLCGDVAPYPNSNGKIDVGDVILLLNNVSHPGNTTYTLCNDWSGDCRCTGVRNMGDVVLLLNNVSYPENTRYVLGCC